MRTRERQLWLGFIEQATGCLALIAVAVVRSPSVDFWSSLAMLAIAYVGGIVVATAILDRRLPFARSRPDAEPQADVSVGVLFAAGTVPFALLLVAFDWSNWPPQVRMFAAIVASVSAGTIGWGIAASGAALPVTRPLGRLRGRIRNSGLGRWFYRGMPLASQDRAVSVSCAAPTLEARQLRFSRR